MAVFTIDEEYFRIVMKMIEMVRAFHRAQAYFRCVRGKGGDWTDLECMGLSEKVEIPSPSPPDPLLLTELLGELPEDEQRQVAASLRRAGDRVIERCTAELEEWSNIIPERDSP